MEVIILLKTWIYCIWNNFLFVEGTFLSAQFSAVSQIIALCVSFFIKSTLLTIN